MTTVIFFIFGLAFGSFLNVLIYRLPRELPFANDRSICPTCGHTLGARDLVPLLSWLFLRRRCRYCQAPISWRYPVVELVNALLWAGVWYWFASPLHAAAFCIMVSCLLVVTLVDWEHQIIPDSMNAGILLAGILLAFAGIHHVSLIDRLIGLFCISVPFFAIVFFSGGRAMGGGDVKLMAVLGFALGWQQALLVTILGALGGTVIALALMRSKKALGRQVPFGSFLASAGIVSIFLGDTLIHWYLSLSGL